MAEPVLPGVVDHHVHLGLVDHARLAGGPVVEVHDLGWDPAALPSPEGVEVRAVGPFHTAPGGYPAGRSWAPPGAVRELASVADVAAAVARLDGLGMKVALHAGMPLLSDELLRAAVDSAHAAGLPVLVHAEGEGQAARAIRAGADVLVHAPWTEPVPDEVLAEGAGMTWISTLAIHAGSPALATALDNVRRFRALGGRVVYGTDMGNGPTPVGVNAEEILLLGEAGLTGEDLLAAVCTGEVELVSPHPRPTTAAELVAWLADARRPPATPPPRSGTSTAEIRERQPRESEESPPRRDEGRGDR